MNRLKMAAAAGACTLLGSGVAAVTQAAPALAASCYNTSCTGKNPIDMGCAVDASTPAYILTFGVSVEVDLRYSAACHAYWAKVIDYGIKVPGELEVIGRVCSDPEILPVRCHAAIHESSGYDASGSSAFTLMIPGDYWARACFSGDGSTWECTP
ncbi:MAG TPA: DUF2690 domain-containing protein [Streptosporangiaceae bacterium]